MKKFDELNLCDELKTSISKLGFEAPTPIQQKVLPEAFAGRDIMACAPTGTGKTAAFSIPLVQFTHENKNQNSLVLAPTRELARQIHDFIVQLLGPKGSRSVALIVGGVDMRRQFRALQGRPRIIVATPGRLNDHLERRSVKLDRTGYLVLDEGDRMLDMGFAPQLERIFGYLPKQRQNMLFTATLAPKVRKLAEKFMSNPLCLGTEEKSRPVENIKQSGLKVEDSKKSTTIVAELNKRDGSVIVFARTKRRTETLSKKLSSEGFLVSHIHGGLSQGQRDRALRSFRAGKSRILCATDVASRGIDVPNVSHVINFDMPEASEDYVHRIGRTARNGAAGEAVSFITPNDYSSWVSLVRSYKIKDVDLSSFPSSGRAFNRKRGGSSSGGGGGGGGGRPGKRRFGASGGKGRGRPQRSRR